MTYIGLQPYIFTLQERDYSVQLPAYLHAYLAESVHTLVPPHFTDKIIFEARLLNPEATAVALYTHLFDKARAISRKYRDNCPAAIPITHCYVLEDTLDFITVEQVPTPIADRIIEATTVSLAPTLVAEIDELLETSPSITKDVRHSLIDYVGLRGESMSVTQLSQDPDPHFGRGWEVPHGIKHIGQATVGLATAASSHG